MVIHAVAMLVGLVAVWIGAERPECWLSVIVVNGVFLRCSQHAMDGKK